MLLEGKSVAAMVARCGRTTNAVKGRASFLGLSVASDKAIRAQRNAGKLKARRESNSA
jgi:hypothetical protein